MSASPARLGSTGLGDEWLALLRGRKLPVVLQTEAAECGLACLAMVAAHHGHRTSLPALRQRFAVSLKGMTLETLMQIGAGVGLAARPLRLELDELPDLQTPCILHWDMNHFVVLHSATRRRVTIHDPAVGVRTLTPRAAGEHFTGVALELTPTVAFEPVRSQPGIRLRSMLGRVVGLNRALAQILLLALCLEVCTIAGPFYMQWLIDQALVASDRDLVAVLGLGFGLLLLLKTALGAFRAWAVTLLGTSMHLQWMNNVFAHLLKLPLEFFEKRHVGDVVSRFGSVNAIQTALTTQVVEAMVDGLLAVGTFAMLVLYSPRLALVALTAVALYAALRAATFAPLRNATAEQIIHGARQQTHFLESVRGAQTIRLFGRGEQRRMGWMNMLADQANAQLCIARVSLGFNTAQALIFGLERVVILWLAALMVLDRSFTVGMLIAVVAYKEQFSTRVAALVDHLFGLRMLRLHGERLADIVLTPVEADAAAGAERHGASPRLPRIELQGVKFRYSPHDPWVLDGVDLEVNPGECLAITGPSGCGKTTLVKVMLGLLKPTEGRVLADGVPVEQMGLAAYRRHIGTVMQDDLVFTGSIAENISFFDPRPDTEHIERCAAFAALDVDIERMPMRYQTLVGESGTGLSGGQKQRLVLARALYRRPQLLVLDEATSHLDVTNERQVSRALAALALTRVVIAHRPESLAIADRVLAMGNGGQVRSLALVGDATARSAAKGTAA